MISKDSSDTSSTAARAPGWLLHRRGALTGAIVFSTGINLLPRIDALLFGVLPVLQAVTWILIVGAIVIAVVLGFRRRLLPGAILVLGALIAAPSILLVSGNNRLDCPPQVDHISSLVVSSLNAGKASADAAGFAAVIEEYDVDVAVVNEVDEFWIGELLSSGVEDRLPHRTGTVTSGGVAGSVILSRYVLETGPDLSSELVFDSPTALLTTNEGANIRIVAVHPYPPLSGAQLWRDELKLIQTELREIEDTSLIVSGDFNATRSHPAYRKLTNGFVDTAIAAGRWPRATWPANSRLPAFAALDHILVRGGTSLSWDTFVVAGTDHAGIVAELSICSIPSA